MDAETDLAVSIRNLPLLGQNTSASAEEELEEAFVMKFHTFVVVFRFCFDLFQL